MIIYVLLMIFLFMLPIKCYQYTFDYLIDLSLKFKFSSEYTHGLNLKKELVVIEQRLLFKNFKVEVSLPQYKFFTELILRIIDLNRSYGINFKDNFEAIKIALNKDLILEKKVKEQKNSNYFQYVSITFIIWGFILFTLNALEIKLDTKIMVWIILLQSLGFLLAFTYQYYFQQKYFNPLRKVSFELHTFYLLLSSGLSLNEIIKKSNILSGELKQNEQYKREYQEILLSVERLKEDGITPSLEVSQIIEGFWQKTEEKLLKFSRNLVQIKFFILVLFYLPSYFIFLLQVYQFFMEQ